ncbi:MAG: FtsX-like permease family protein, partial [Pseudomonadota bacterium]
REALTVVTDISEKLAAAVRLTAGVTLVAGVLVLAGAIAAGHRRRVYEAVVMKVLGATRGDMLRSHLTEFGALGLVTAVIAAGIGVAAGWAVVEHVLFIDFSLALGPVVASAGIGALATLIAGAAGSWTALGRKAAPLLRNE